MHDRNVRRWSLCTRVKVATTVQDKHAAQAGAQQLRNLSAAQWAFSEKPLSLAGALGASFIENVDAVIITTMAGKVRYHSEHTHQR